jgi:hypothetical protein
MRSLSVVPLNRVEVVAHAEIKAPLRKVHRASYLVILTAMLSGCAGLSSFTEPERLYSIDDEVAAVRAYNDNPDMWRKYAGAPDQDAFRNNIITTRMYAIDIEYTKYEAALTHEGQGVDFATKLASLGLTTTAGLIPVLQTSHALSEAATGVNSLDSAYNDKVLRSQLIQNTQAAMRIARHDQAAIIFANMQCPVKLYPLGRALTDLEAYYRAGTFASGIMKLSQTVLKAESDAKAGQDSKAPSNANGADNAAKTELRGSGETIKAKGEPPQGCSAPQQGPPLTFRKRNT